MDHLFDCEFRCEDSYARSISVDLGKTILVVPALAGFSHSQGQYMKNGRLEATSAWLTTPELRTRA